MGDLTKAHVEHPVCFIKHKVRHSLQVGCLCLNQVNQPSLRIRQWGGGGGGGSRAVEGGGGGGGGGTRAVEGGGGSQWY